MRVILSLIFSVGLVYLRRTVSTLLSLQKLRKLDVLLLCGYVLLVLLITIGVRSYDDESIVNLNPIKSYSQIFRTLVEGIQSNAFLQRFRWVSAALEGYALNVLLFVPFGYLIPSVLNSICRCWKVVLLGFATSLTIETIQLVTCLGWFDASDLLHNTVGTWIGWIIYKKVLGGSTESLVGEDDIKND